MKIGRILTLGAIAYGAYYAYTNRKAILAGYQDLKESAGYISDDLNKIKRNLDIIQEQGQVLADLSQDFNHKSRVFQKEAQARFDVIQERLSKYQSQD